MRYSYIYNALVNKTHCFQYIHNSICETYLIGFWHLAYMIYLCHVFKRAGLESQPVSDGLATVRNRMNKHKHSQSKLGTWRYFKAPATCSSITALLILKAHYEQTVMLQQGYENS